MIKGGIYLFIILRGVFLKSQGTLCNLQNRRHANKIVFDCHHHHYHHQTSNCRQRKNAVQSVKMEGKAVSHRRM